MKEIIKAKLALFRIIAGLLSAYLLTYSVHAQADTNNTSSLKSDMVGLSAELRMLEEQLLFPENEQLAVFLSIDTSGRFDINGIKLLLDDHLMVNKTYTARQTDAFNRGGVERVYLGNISVGEHELTAFFTGLDQRENKTKRALTTTFAKQSKATAIELQIVINADTGLPEFIAKEL